MIAPPFTGCETCWDFQLVFELPCRWLWVPYKRRYIETAFIPCPDCAIMKRPPKSAVAVSAQEG